MFENELVERLLSRFEALASENGRLAQRLDDIAQELHDVKVGQNRSFVDALVPLLVTVIIDPKNRIRQIKAMRNATGLGLKEAKNLIDDVFRLVQEKEDNQNNPF